MGADVWIGLGLGHGLHLRLDLGQDMHYINFVV